MTSERDIGPIPATVASLRALFDMRPVLWVGADASVAAGYARCEEILGALRKHARGAAHGGLFEVADFYIADQRGEELRRLLGLLVGREASAPTRLHKAIAALAHERTFAAVLTSNFDRLLERSFERENVAHRVHGARDLDAASADPADPLPVIKLHPSFDEWREDLASGSARHAFTQRYQALLSCLDASSVERPVVLVGCSMEDPFLLDWLAACEPARRSAFARWHPVLTRHAWEQALVTAQRAHPGDDRAFHALAAMRPLLVEDHERHLPDLFVQAAGANTHARAAPDPLISIHARIREAEVPFSGPLAEVTDRIEAKEAVVVLTARRGGSTTFARQLSEHLRARHPSWSVHQISARPLVTEFRDVDAYMERMRGLMPVNQGDSPLVLCIHGFSRHMAQTTHHLSDHARALGQQLRAYLEGSGVTRPCSLVAVGGHPLFLLRYGDGEHSLLNQAKEVALPGLDPDQILALMEVIEPGRFQARDASEVARMSGGHPHLVKALVHAWYECDARAGRGLERWRAAEERLENDRDYLHPTLTRIASRDANRDVLRDLLARGQVKRKIGRARWAGHHLLYTGLLRETGRFLELRCEVVARLVGEMLEDDE